MSALQSIDVQPKNKFNFLKATLGKSGQLIEILSSATSLSSIQKIFRDRSPAKVLISQKRIVTVAP